MTVDTTMQIGAAEAGQEVDSSTNDEQYISGGLNLPSDTTATATSADVVAAKTLDGAEEGDPAGERTTQSFLACVINPLAKVWKETIWPALQKVVELARDYLFCCICPATSKAPATVPVQVRDGEELTDADLDRLDLNTFVRNEGARFDNRTVCGGASFKMVGAGTVRRPEGLKDQAVVKFDKRFVGGLIAAATPTEVKERLQQLDAKKTFAAFKKLDDGTQENILQNAAIAMGIEGSEEGTWADQIKKDAVSFGNHFGAIREGITAYFSDRAETIIATRQKREAAATSTV